jgi:histidinol-phosphate phosphatase family protein
MNKAVFLDRDGVINQKAQEHDYIKSQDEFQLIEGAAKAIHLLNEQGYKVIVVTNQRGIARGLMTEQDLITIHEKMNNELQKHGASINGIYYCPHDIDVHCHCRKPKTGMLEQAAVDFNINKEASYMVGDSQSDIEAGVNFGIKAILVGLRLEGVLYAADLLSAVKNIILQGDIG